MRVQNANVFLTVFSVKIKDDLLQLFCGIPVKIGKILQSPLDIKTLDIAAALAIAAATRVTTSVST